MRSAKFEIILVAILAVVCLTGHAFAQPQLTSMEAADKLFQSGKFADAGAIYEKIASHDPNNDKAISKLGHIALLSNRLDASRDWLDKAIALRPHDVDLKIMLAAALHRLDDYQNAAAVLRGSM